MDDCVVHVTQALESVPGVQHASVDLESRSAVVTAASRQDYRPGTGTNEGC